MPHSSARACVSCMPFDNAFEMCTGEIVPAACGQRRSHACYARVASQVRVMPDPARTRPCESVRSTDEERAKAAKPPGRLRARRRPWIARAALPAWRRHGNMGAEGNCVSGESVEPADTHAIRRRQRHGNDAACPLAMVERLALVRLLVARLLRDAVQRANDEAGGIRLNGTGKRTGRVSAQQRLGGKQIGRDERDPEPPFLPLPAHIPLT